MSSVSHLMTGYSLESCCVLSQWTPLRTLRTFVEFTKSSSGLMKWPKTGGKTFAVVQKPSFVVLS